MPKPADITLSALPKLEATDVRLMWVNDWYDGPLEAVVERAGERLLMVLHAMPEARAAGEDAPWQWLLYPLTPAQWEEEDRWHALFEQHVGHHWCFHHDSSEPEVREPESREPQRFYEPYKSRKPLDLSSNVPVAWLDQMPAK